MGTELKVLMRAESIIQRDAVMSALTAEGINAFAEEREISRKIADTTVDLAYEGYSAVFDGFTIQVNAADFDRAKAVADRVVARARAAPSDKTLEEGSSMRKFYFCCLFSVLIPVIFNGLAVYHFVRGLQKGERPSVVWGLMSLLLFSFSTALAFYFIFTADLVDTLRALSDSL